MESEVENLVNQWDALWENEYVNHVNNLAMAEVKKKVSTKQYQIFHLYCIKEQDLKRIATFLGASSNEVYLAKNRVQPLYEEALRRILEDAREAVLA